MAQQGTGRGGGIHTIPNGDGRYRWANKYHGEVVSRHRRKANAVKAGRALAMVVATEHTIHGKTGIILSKNSYGNDPCPPRDAS